MDDEAYKEDVWLPEVNAKFFFLLVQAPCCLLSITLDFVLCEAFESSFKKYLTKAASAVGPRIGPRRAIGPSNWAETGCLSKPRAAGRASLSSPLSIRPG
ncbi:hypothetical protein AAHA92_25125 [Salvia divinorum]|uniref:Uncharacterized protein n=1 Tax=Salvia divinorum TaxID=28513 RepID=A0ABD1G9N3_SALDI